MRTGTFYEINVSRKGKHIFATDGSIRNYDHGQIIEILTLFSEKFPKSEEFEVGVTTWSCGCPALHEDIATVLKEKWSKF